MKEVACRGLRQFCCGDLAAVAFLIHLLGIKQQKTGTGWFQMAKNDRRLGE
jgi:hypothetical protein